MLKARCPGQDTRYWTPENIYEVPCAHCGAPLEMFKDDLRRRCPQCGRFSLNPKNDLTCLAWCKSSAECLAQLGGMVSAPSGEER